MGDGFYDPAVTRAMIYDVRNRNAGKTPTCPHCLLPKPLPLGRLTDEF
jgi:hypothetical protein